MPADGGAMPATTAAMPLEDFLSPRALFASARLFGQDIKVLFFQSREEVTLERVDYQSVKNEAGFHP